MTEDERELLLLLAEKVTGLMARHPQQPTREWYEEIDTLVERIRNPQYPGSDR